VVVSYIYFTRIAVFLLGATLPYDFSWLVALFSQVLVRRGRGRGRIEGGALLADQLGRGQSVGALRPESLPRAAC
jgi:hypothetical protein